MKKRIAITTVILLCLALMPTTVFANETEGEVVAPEVAKEAVATEEASEEPTTEEPSTEEPVQEDLDAPKEAEEGIEPQSPTEPETEEPKPDAKAPSDPYVLAVERVNKATFYHEGHVGLGDLKIPASGEAKLTDAIYEGGAITIYVEEFGIVSDGKYIERVWILYEGDDEEDEDDNEEIASKESSRDSSEELAESKVEEADQAVKEEAKAVSEGEEFPEEEPLDFPDTDWLVIAIACLVKVLKGGLV